MKKVSCLNSVFYIVPHADDWQLFMNPQTYNDIILPQNKVIFIITTAGDAGLGEQFWLSREQGMKASILYSFTPSHSIKIKEGRIIVNKMSLKFSSIRSTMSYFLRLPDGGLNGEGFEANNFQNLEKLEAGSISSLSSLDDNITLFSWNSFCSLLENIIILESASCAGNVHINFLDPEKENNPMDHADHYCTGRAINSLRNLPIHTKILFKGYGNSCTNQLTAEEVFWKAGTFAAYENTIYDKTGYSTLGENLELYKKWILSRPEFNKVEKECIW